MATGQALLAVEHLSKQYGNVVALNDVSFTITDGITGILGENGAGKSTAIKILLGLMPADVGLRHGARAEHVEERRRPRARRLHARARLSAEPGECRRVPDAHGRGEGLPPTRARTRAADTLRHAGLFEERYRAIGGYSTGMKQRVKLGQALVHDPSFVFLDEPTAGLDPAGREDMLALIRKTHREFGISVLFSSHLMADVERTCDRIIVLMGGRLVHAGEVAQFTKEMESVFIEVDTNREQLVGALERRASCDLERGGLTIEGADVSMYDHVRDALVEAQAPLRRMAPQRRALTELFERESA